MRFAKRICNSFRYAFLGRKAAHINAMSMMTGTAVPERRASMSDLIYRLEMEAKEK